MSDHNIDLDAEHRASLRALTREHADFLVGLGISPLLISVYQLVGVARIRITGGKWQHDEAGASAFITPHRVHDPLTPLAPDPFSAVRFGEIGELVAWHPQQPHHVVLRTGGAEWLGARTLPQIDPFPPYLRSGVLSWLKADCDGVVLLARHPREQKDVLYALGNTVIVETKAEQHRLVAAIERAQHSRIPRFLVSSSREAEQYAVGPGKRKLGEVRRGISADRRRRRAQAEAQWRR